MKYAAFCYNFFTSNKKKKIHHNSTNHNTIVVYPMCVVLNKIDSIVLDLYRVNEKTFMH